MADIEKDFFEACVKALGTNKDGSLSWSEHNEAACRAAWKRLTYRQREMLKLVCGAGNDERRYESHEVAQIFNVTTPYVKRLISDAQRQFIADVQRLTS